MTRSEVTIKALTGIKLVEPGDDLGAITVAALAANGLAPQDGDVLVVAQKIVSKAEGRYVDVAAVEPSERAIALAAETDKDPRFVEVVLGEFEARGAPSPRPADCRAPAWFCHGQCRYRPLEHTEG